MARSEPSPPFVLKVAPDEAKKVGKLAQGYNVMFYDRPISTHQERLTEKEYAELFRTKRKIVERIRGKIDALLAAQDEGKRINENALKKLYEDEYKAGVYNSVKYGLENGRGFLGLDMEQYGSVVEIGGGPGPFSRGVKAQNPRQKAYVMDLADSQVLKDALARESIDYLAGNILSGKDARRLVNIGKRSKEKPPFYVMSYFLDRVPDQKLALANFAKVLESTGGDGLVTVCLPAHESKFVKFKREDWLTTSGNDPVKDLEALTEYCRGLGLTIGEIGITTHAGTSVDGYERIPAYCFRVYSKRSGNQPKRPENA